MRPFIVTLGVLAAGLVTPATSAVTDSAIGAVLDREFTGATGQRAGDEARELYFDLPVHSAERVDTGAEARTALVFLDDTRLQVGPNSSVLLDRFIYDPERQTGDAALSFGRGLFRFVTGEMRNKDGFDLRTPSATLAIRGTKFIVFVASNGDTILSVIEGVVEMRPCDGTLHIVAAGESATAAGNCTDSGKVVGRLAPRDKAVDDDYSRFALGQAGDRNGNSRASSKGRP